MIGTEVAGVAILSEIGAGGMGVVMRGRRKSDGANVAVKFIRESESADQGFVARFEREARILESLDQENILRIHQWGKTHDGHFYIIMELIEGCSLGDILKVRQKIAPEFALQIALGTARALESAWKKSVVHRDVKPDNVLISYDGQVKLVDFGLAKDTSDNSKFTITGQVVGTPAFMSPEQGLGEKVDHRTDIYSLGATLYTMLAGRRPFDGVTPIEIVIRQTSQDPPDLSEAAPDVPQPVSSLVRRMMARRPEDRPSSMTEVVSELESMCSSDACDTSTIRDLVETATVATKDVEDLTAPPRTPAALFRDDSGATPATDAPGNVIAGKYQVERQLGKGGMGSVFLVRHMTLNQRFALKVLNPSLASNESFRRRFMREAKAASSFVHKHAVQIREFGADGPMLYMTMDYCEGRTLSDLLDEEGSLTEQRAASIAHQMLQALKEAHAAGLIHRDLKPGNVMIEKKSGADHVRILDFGIAKMASAEGEDEMDAAPITGAGAVVGTVQYMAPEQAVGDRVDARSDVYALATILYETVSGTLPITGENQRKLLFNIVSKPPVPLSAAVKGVSRPFEKLVMRNLAKNPADRCQSAEEFLAELESISKELKSSVAIRRKGLPAWAQAAFGAVLLVIAAAVAYMVLDPFSSKQDAPISYLPAGPTPLEIAARRKALHEAFDAAMSQRDFESALDKVSTLLTLVDTSQERIELERRRSALNAELDRAASIWEYAASCDAKGEVLKALPKYEEFARDFPADRRAPKAAERAAAIPVEVHNSPGLALYSEPEGATVFLDGVEAGTTPLILSGIEPGKRVIGLDLKGYIPQIREIDWTEGARDELRIALREGGVGNIKVLSSGPERLMVRFLGELQGMTPWVIEKVEEGEQQVEVGEVGGASYAVKVRVRRDQTSLLPVDFGRLAAEEEEAWSKIPRGATPAQTIELHREFLSRFPKGRRSAQCEKTIADIEEEERSFEACRAAASERSILRACGEYLSRYQSLSYPHNWHFEEVVAIRDGLQAAMEERAYSRIAASEGFDDRIKACEEYLDSHGSGSRSGQVARILEELKSERDLIFKYDRESVYWKKVEYAKECLSRHSQGMQAARVASELAALETAEKEAASAALSVRDPETFVSMSKRFLEEYSGGPGSVQVQARAIALEEERRFFLTCSNSISNCREYLARYPEGFYNDRVERLILTFAWPPDEAGILGYGGKLPPGLIRGENVGEYACERDGAVMLYVPAGFYPMGADDWRGGRNEMPSFNAYVSAFFIDKYEVTNNQYRKFLSWIAAQKAAGRDPHALCHESEPPGKDHEPQFFRDPAWNGSDQPVVGVDWFDAFAYARWAGKRLPTEAQWEKAASADIERKRKYRWPFGDDPPAHGMANFGEDEFTGITRSVSSHAAGRSPVGAFNMAGNVSEWCLDAYEPDFYRRFKKSPYGPRTWPTNPFNDAVLDLHSVRGGNFRDGELGIRSTRREGFAGRRKETGFRCALWLDTAAARRRAE